MFSNGSLLTPCLPLANHASQQQLVTNHVGQVIRGRVSLVAAQKHNHLRHFERYVFDVDMATVTPDLDAKPGATSRARAFRPAGISWSRSKLYLDQSMRLYVSSDRTNTPSAVM